MGQYLDCISGQGKSRTSAFNLLQQQSLVPHYIQRCHDTKQLVTANFCVSCN